MYFCSLEALNNIAKYARLAARRCGSGATTATSRSRSCDDGEGFDADRDGLRDRSARHGRPARRDRWDARDPGARRAGHAGPGAGAPATGDAGAEPRGDGPRAVSGGRSMRSLVVACALPHRRRSTAKPDARLSAITYSRRRSTAIGCNRPAGSPGTRSVAPPRDRRSSGPHHRRTGAYTDRALVSRGPCRSGLGAWLDRGRSCPMLAVFFPIFLLFPDGRLPRAGGDRRPGVSRSRPRRDDARRSRSRPGGIDRGVKHLDQSMSRTRSGEAPEAIVAVTLSRRTHEFAGGDPPFVGLVLRFRRRGRMTASRSVGSRSSARCSSAHLVSRWCSGVSLPDDSERRRHRAFVLVFTTSCSGSRSRAASRS